MLTFNSLTQFVLSVVAFRLFVQLQHFSTTEIFLHLCHSVFIIFHFARREAPNAKPDKSKPCSWFGFKPESGFSNSNFRESLISSRSERIMTRIYQYALMLKGTHEILTTCRLTQKWRDADCLDYNILQQMHFKLGSLWKTVMK